MVLYVQPVFLRVKSILSQIIKIGVGGVLFMQTVDGIQYCQSIENVDCLLPCYFCFLYLGVQNHNKDLAISFFGVAFCSCTFPQCTELNHLPMSPSSFIPRKKTFNLNCCWTGWSLSLSVSSLKYAPKLTQQSWSCSYSDQRLECAEVSSVYTCISFLRKPKYGQNGKRKEGLLCWTYICELSHEFYMSFVIMYLLTPPLLFSLVIMNKLHIFYVLQWKKWGYH